DSKKTTDNVINDQEEPIKKNPDLKEEVSLNFQKGEMEVESSLPQRLLEGRLKDIDEDFEPYKTTYELILNDKEFKDEYMVYRLLDCMDRTSQSPEECKDWFKRSDEVRGKKEDYSSVEAPDEYYSKNNEEYELTEKGEDYKELIRVIEYFRGLNLGIDEKSIELGETKMSIDLSHWSSPEGELSAELLFNNQIKIAEHNFEMNGKFQNFGESPFVQVKSEECSTNKDSQPICRVSYKYANNFIQNTGEITDKAELNSLLRVKFNKKTDASNTIIIEDNNGGKICEFEWSNSFNEQKKCINKEYPQGLGIIVRDAFHKDVSKDIRKDKASVQIEYNPKEFESECCPDW
ncbi:MAG: hypothetical protein ACOCQX_04380, partial [Candidatus Nanoarchaeia archaeon]